MRLRSFVFSAFLLFLFFFNISIAYSQVEDSTTEIDSCTILDKQGETYILTKDIINDQDKDCIEIANRSITLDCQEHMIVGEQKNYGIVVDGLLNPNNFNLTIKNCIVKNFRYGIYVPNLDNNHFENLKLIDNVEKGMYLFYSSGNILRNIYVSGNKIGLCTQHVGDYGEPKIISEYYDIYAENNSQYGLSFCTNFGIKVENATLIDNGEQDLFIEAYDTPNCNYSLQNVVSSDGRPIEFYNSPITIKDRVFSELILCDADNSYLENVTIKGSDTINNNFLQITATSKSTFKNINSNNNLYGIFFLKKNDNNLLIDSSFEGNNVGIFFDVYNINNIVKNSYFKYNKKGIFIDDFSESNLFYNNFFRNIVNIDSVSKQNFWNTDLSSNKNILGGELTGGNYWSSPDNDGFSDTCRDSDNNSICDNVYEINPLNYDSYPLTRIIKQKNFIRGDANMDGTVDLADAISILSYLFRDGELNCEDATDVNDDGQLDLVDANYILNYLFRGGDEPKNPFPELGLDLTEDELGCGI